MLRPTIRLNEIERVELPAGEVSTTAINEITGYMKGIFSSRNKDFVLPENWSWIWDEAKVSNYPGTLPKRLSKFAFENDIKLLPGTLEYIGIVAKNGAHEEKVTYYDFTSDFDWQDGMYGDGGSCLWGGNGRALRNMEHSNCLAFRIYKPFTEVYRVRDQQKIVRNNTYGSLYGVGRIWMRIDYPQKDMITMWNGYGPWSNPSLHFARTLGYIFSMPYKKVRLYNNDGGWVCLNGGDSGYIIGSLDQLEELREVDIDVPDQGEVECF